MHSYLKSIGFSSLKTEEELEKVLEYVFRKCKDCQGVKEENGNAFVEYALDFGHEFGIKLCGEMDTNGFHQEYYFPYFKGTGITSREDLSVEKHGSRESYAGVLEDPRVGISLIFYVQNAVDYKKACREKHLLTRQITTTFSGLADRGKILFPIRKTEEQLQYSRETSQKRNGLLAAARRGDQEAMESLTVEDMDLHLMISQRLQGEDILSIVDTFMMPFGMECDLYQIMGEILNVEEAVNN